MSSCDRYRAIERGAAHWLRHPIPHPDWSTPMQKIDLSDLEMAKLREQLGHLPEPRGGRRQLHPPTDGADHRPGGHPWPAPGAIWPSVSTPPA